MTDRPVAVVTGASRGIGRAIALALSTAGHDIVGVARTLKTTGDKPGLDGLKADIEASGVSFLALQMDVGDIKQHPRLISDILKRFGRIDLWVNNAGVTVERRLDVLETTAESFDRVLGINLRGTFFLTQAAVKAMLGLIGKIKDYHPRIIFITSISADMSSPNRPEYCISKAGLSMATRIFADRLAGSGVKIYEIRPGIIQSAMTAPVKEHYDQRIADGLIPQGRWGTPEDVAQAVIAIASGQFDYSTGMVIEVSGGMNIRHL